MGRTKLTEKFANRLNARLAVIEKRRIGDSEVVKGHVVGEITGRNALIIDDMISTGGTITEAVATLLEADAHPHMTVIATHGVLVEGARDRLSHPAIQAMLVTDSVAIPPMHWPQLHVVSIAPLLASAIRRWLADGSLEGFG